MKYPKSELYTKMLMEEEIKRNVEIKNCPVEVVNDISNAAIEEAAKLVENRGLIGMSTLSDNIRKLKK